MKYDKIDRLVEFSPHLNGLPPASRSYTYDASGNITQQTTSASSDAITDTDGDKIDDEWEIYYFSNLSTADITTDTDNDRYSDYWEYQNWRAHVRDPAGKSFQPLEANAPAGRGYDLDSADYPPDVVTDPIPVDMAESVKLKPLFSWSPANGAASYRLFLGVSPNLGPEQLIYNNVATSFTPSTPLADATHYFWRVDACQNGGANCSTGQVWQFSTEGGGGSRPEKVSTGMPAYGAIGQPLTTTLRWQGVVGATDYNIYFGISADPPWVKRQSGGSGTNSYAVSLAPNTTYYWRIDSVNGNGKNRGDVWQFTTGSSSASSDPLTAVNFWMTPGAIYAHPDESVKTRVFEAKCTITNNSDRIQHIQQIALAVHYPYVNGDAIIDLYDPTTWTARYLKDVTLTPGSSINFPLSAGSLKNPGEYHLRVNIKQNNQWRAIATKTFEVLDQPVETPAANTPFPASGATNVSTDVTMRWSNTGRVYAPGGSVPPYVLCMDTDSNITQSDCTIELDSPQYSPADLQPGTKYYWRIASFGATGQSLGPLWSFTTMPQVTSPSGQLSVLFNKADDTFSASFSVNDHTEQVKIFYSYDNGTTWNQIFTTNILSLHNLTTDFVLPDENNHQTVSFYLQAIRNSGTPEIYSTDQQRVNYSTEDPVEKPAAPIITISSNNDTATIVWKKILDSHYRDTIRNYEIEYATTNTFSGSTSKLIGNPAAGTSLYEILSYPINGLLDNSRYYFRVRAKNSAGTGNWSNIAFTDIAINDIPVIDTGYQVPSDNATGVDKTPTLRWQATDADGDDLYYGVWFGKTPQTMNSLVSINDLTRVNENSLTLPHRWQDILEPGTTYYWQVRVREKGRYRKFYGGEYPASPIWSFTTQTTGPDPAITNVVRIGEVKPGCSVLFRVTVKNLGVDNIGTIGITSSYIKNGTASPFRIGSGATGKTLAPGDETTVDIAVKFKDSIIEQNGIIYDNILVPGTSTVKFTLSTSGFSDVNSGNNTGQVDINYVNPGGPDITYFDLREYKSMLGDPSDFKARTGKQLQIIVNAADDTRIKSGRIYVRRHPSENWTLIYNGTNDDATFSFVESGCLPGVTMLAGNAIAWTVPTDFLTSEAEVRVQFLDDADTGKEQLSIPFPVVSGSLSASITVGGSLFQVGQNIEWNESWTSDAPVIQQEVWLRAGPRSERLLETHNTGGILISNPYSVLIPNDNDLASQHCILELHILDEAGNEQTVVSENFQVQDNKDLPAPFNESILVYNDEFNFPVDSIRQLQHREVDFLKLDSANVVHIIFRHEYGYFNNTESGVAEDDDIHERNMYYISYDPQSQTVSSKILVCDKDFSVVSFNLFNDIPYVLLKDRQETLYYSYLDSGQFQPPVPIENGTIPKVMLPLSQVDSFGNQDYGWVQPGGYAFLNGEQWLLDIPSNTVHKHSFAGGHFGSIQNVTVTNNAGNVGGNIIKPATVNDSIYFVDKNGTKLVRLDTVSKVVDAYNLPFTVDSTEEARHKVSLLAKNGKVFLFGNGHVYEFISSSSSFIDHGEIAYTFNGTAFSIATIWNEVAWLQTVTTETTSYMIVGYESYPASVPMHTKHEILQFNSQSATFTKSVVKVGSSMDDRLGRFYTAHGSSFPFKRYPDIEYIGDNKVLAVTAAGGLIDSSGVYDYESGLQLLDLETGDITFIDYLGLESSGGHTSLLKENGNVNLLTSQESTGENISVMLNLSNIDAAVNEVESPELINFNESLYAIWSKGVPFDGRWDNSNNFYRSKGQERNKKYDIISLGSTIENIADHSLGSSVAVNGDFLASSRGQLFTLYPDLTLAESVKNLFGYQGVQLLANNGHYAGALGKYIGGSATEIQLVSPDASTTLFNVPSNGSVVADFPGQIITAGYGYGDFSGRNVVTKQDASSNQLSTIVFGSAGNTFDYQHRADINENQYVAVGWSNYLALADFSRDIVAPEIHILDSGGQVHSSSEITLHWDASDNLNQIDRFELYLVSGGIESHIASITNSTVRSHTFTLNGNSGDRIGIKIVVYDVDGNSTYDQVDYEIVQPIVITSFTVNKTNLELGDTLQFNWNVNDFDPLMIFTVFRRKIGHQDWIEFFSVAGRFSFEQEINSFTGEYEFKLVVRDGSVQLQDTVVITGEMLQFDSEKFSPVDHYYVSGDSPDNCIVPLHWGVEGVSDLENIYFSVYVRKEFDTNFIKIADTLTPEYNLSLSGPCSNFSWNVHAQYQGAVYISSTHDVSLAEIQSPALTNLSIARRGTPEITASFMSNLDSGQYHLMRSTNGGQTTEVGQVDIATELHDGGKCAGGICNVGDNTANYGEVYHYYVVTSYGNKYYPPGAALTADLTSAGLNSSGKITILNKNYSVLATNSLTLDFQPSVGSNIVSYEILLGFSDSSTSLYRFTNSTSVSINDLSFNHVYCIQIYGLDALGARITSVPAQLFVSTPPVPTPFAPFNLSGVKNHHGVQLTWSTANKFTQTFIVERKSNNDVEYQKIATTSQKNFTDLSSIVGSRSYRVKSYTETGASPYSNIVTINGESIIDTDNDGIDDEWELFHFGSLGVVNRYSNFDGDGYTDLWEYLNWNEGIFDTGGYSFDPTIINLPGSRGDNVMPGKRNILFLALPAFISGNHLSQ